MLRHLKSSIDKVTDLQSMRFITQQPNEKIRLLLRQHVVVNTRWIGLVIILCLIPPALWFGLYELNLQIQTNVFQIHFTSYELAAIVTLYYVIVFYIGFLNLLKWFFNVLIITSHRIIDINYYPPFKRQVTQAQLEEIQDVEATQQGIFAILFNYGNLFLQTAGTRQNISLDKIPNPNNIHNKIINILP